MFKTFIFGNFIILKENHDNREKSMDKIPIVKNDG